MKNEMDIKYADLLTYLKGLKSVAVAFSGGVDSSFLLQASINALGDKVLAVTAASSSFPKRELEEAKAFCLERGVKQIFVGSNELEIEGFRENPKNRCYLCKKELFGKILQVAEKYGAKAVLEGSNTDDEGDYRPGLVAIRELGIKSPLRRTKFNKAEIRALSKEMGLSTWNKQPFACLYSRFVYGETITEEKLNMVDKAEQLLLNSGFRQVRVRIHNNLARIEISPDEFDKIMRQEMRNKIYSSLVEYGFNYVALDLKGYRTGSMNETFFKNVSSVDKS